MSQTAAIFVLYGTSTLINVLVLTALWLRLRASGGDSWRKPVGSLRAEFADLLALVDELLESHKRLRSREGMRDLRARRGQEPHTTIPSADGGTRRAARRALGVPDNPISATLKNLTGDFAPARRNRSATSSEGEDGT